MSQTTYPSVYPDDASVKANAESYLTSAQRARVSEGRKAWIGLLLALSLAIGLVFFFIFMLAWIMI